MCRQRSAAQPRVDEPRFRQRELMSAVMVTERSADAQNDQTHLRR
jgi:hypothetical protein